MIYGSDATLLNGLYLSVDWLSFTLPDPCTYSDALSLMGYSLSDFKVQSAGLNGYASQLRLDSPSCYVSVQYDGHEGMGVHVDISGSSVQSVLESYGKENRCCSFTPFGGSSFEYSDFQGGILVDFLKDICSIGHITRIDVAIDDIGEKYFSVSQLREIFVSSLYVSKFRTWEERAKYSKDYQNMGHTLYLGSRKSDVMLRIYDKMKEQNEKLMYAGEPLLSSPWTRWEFEFKHGYAEKVASYLISGRSLASVAVGVLNNYLRIIVPDNARKDRCSVSPVWLAFTMSVEKLSLYCKPAPKTLVDKKSWLGRQVAPTLATVFMAEGGDMDFFYKLLDGGRSRLSASNMQLIKSSLGVIV